MRAHVLETLAHIDPQVDGVHIADRVGDRSLRVFADFECRLDGCLQVTHVVHRVEDAEHVYAVDGAALHELAHEIVGVVAITENVLPTKQHLLRRIRHRSLQTPNTLPRILAEVTDTGVKCRAAPGLDRPEADLVQFVGNRQHVLDAHARRQQALMSIAQRQFRDAQWILITHNNVSRIKFGSCDATRWQP